MSRYELNEHNQKYTEWILSVLGELKEDSFVYRALNHNKIDNANIAK